MPELFFTTLEIKQSETSVLISDCQRLSTCIDLDAGDFVLLARHERQSLFARFQVPNVHILSGRSCNLQKNNNIFMLKKWTVTLK